MALKVASDKDANLNELVLIYVFKICKQSPQYDMFISGDVILLFGSQSCKQGENLVETWLLLLHNCVSKRVLNSASLTFWLILDEFLHLALFERVDHVGQTALASLRSAQS